MNYARRIVRFVMENEAVWRLLIVLFGLLVLKVGGVLR